MTPCERAEALTDDEIEMFLDDIYDTNIDGRPEVVRLYVSKWLAELARALLADDEATIEAMARALVIRTAEHYGDLLPIDLDLSLTKLLARAVLAALRRKALVGALH